MTHEEKLKKYRLSQPEFEKMKASLGHEPSNVEWALFSALWSEHCSYKSSKIHLSKFALKSAKTLTGMGENAGVVDLGQGEKVAFKMESHNHPSFIEPVQGSATGVGGILRDIFTMGAKPIMLADYLCFGDPSADRMSSLVAGVAKGISSYGNCVGVPTVTGQTEFDESYNKNILVNAFALGYLGKNDKMVSAKAEGVGFDVVYVGAKTGRDGIHGASMASQSFSGNDKEQAAARPTVQIGDPFYEKLLIESCLEVVRENLVVSMQDMGAAGLTSSSFEMASRGDVGFELHLDKVPMRDSTLGPEELLLSESQERMLLIVEPKNREKVKAVFEKWGLDSVAIGKVIQDRKMKLYWHGEVICDIDPHVLTENAPKYEREFKRRELPATPYARWSEFVQDELNKDKKQNLLAQIASPQGCSRSFITSQYDQRVGTRTTWDCAQPIAVVQLPESKRWLAVATGCRPAWMRVHALIGGPDALLEPALQLALRGFTPYGTTDCMNFGNPQKPDMMTDFVESVEGIAFVAKELDSPVISGNVSFYNETEDRNITSTPAVAVVGLSENKSIKPAHFVNEGDKIFVVQNSLAISFAHAMRHSPVTGDWNVKKACDFTKWTAEWSQKDFVSSSYLVGKFGLLYSLFRMSKQFGCDLKSIDDNKAFWQAERLYEWVMTVPAAKAVEVEKLKASLEKIGGQCVEIGVVKGTDFILDNIKFGSINDLKSEYENGWRKHFPQLA